MWNEYNVFLKNTLLKNQCLLYINKTIYLIYIRHCITKQDNLLYIIKTIYYMKIRKSHALYMPAGAFIFLKNSVCVFGAPAGAFILPKNSVCVFGAPAGAFIFLKKSISVLNMPPGASQSSSRTSQSWPRGRGTAQGRPRGGRGAGGGRGPAGEGKVWFRVHETILWDTPDNPPDPPDPPEVVSWSAARTPLPHAPGVRMTWVENKLPQITHLLIKTSI